MKPFINLEENIGKVVGHRRPPKDAFAAGMGLQKLTVRLGEEFGQRLVPKGVYRFRSHEEADAWMWKMLARRRKKASAS